MYFEKAASVKMHIIRYFQCYIYFRELYNQRGISSLNCVRTKHCNEFILNGDQSCAGKLLYFREKQQEQVDSRYKKPRRFC